MVKIVEKNSGCSELHRIQNSYSRTAEKNINNRNENNEQ
jgi:hypothetical protein